MKKVFLDTNVLLDFVTHRNGYEEACDILQLGEDSMISLYASYLTMANTAYVARKGRTQEELYEIIEGLSEMITVLSMDQNQLKDVLKLKASDMEDVMQYVCALSNQCDLIITRNTRHFSFSNIPVYTPTDFLDLYQ